jgi:hypothetical protein
MHLHPFSPSAHRPYVAITFVTAMNMTRRAGLCGCLLLVAGVLAACESATLPAPVPEPLGHATLTVHDPEGAVVFDGSEAAFFVYNNGPGPADRAMYLALGGSASGQMLEVVLYQSLPAYAEVPVAGSYSARWGSMAGDPTMGGDVLRRRGPRMNQLFPIEEESTVVLEEVGHDRIRGRLSLRIVEQHPAADPAALLEGTFEAVRAPHFEDLPRPVSHPRR